MQTAWRAAHTQGGCSVPQADVSIWQTRCSGIEAENQTAGAVEGCVIARYLVLGTKSRARSCAAAGSRFATAVRRSQALRWVGSGSRGGRAGACRGTAYSGLCSARVGLSSVSSPRWSAQQRKERAAQRCCRWRGATSGRPMDVAKVPGGGGGSAGLAWADGVMCGTACFWRRRMR